MEVFKRQVLKMSDKQLYKLIKFNLQNPCKNKAVMHILKKEKERRNEAATKSNC